jgi:hypothetical protein
MALQSQDKFVKVQIRPISENIVGFAADLCDCTSQFTLIMPPDRVYEGYSVSKILATDFKLGLDGIYRAESALIELDPLQFSCKYVASNKKAISVLDSRYSIILLPKIVEGLKTVTIQKITLELRTSRYNSRENIQGKDITITYECEYKIKSEEKKSVFIVKQDQLMAYLNAPTIDAV